MKVAQQEEVKPVPTASIGVPQAISETSESTFLKELKEEESLKDILSSQEHLFSTEP